MSLADGSETRLRRRLTQAVRPGGFRKAASSICRGLTLSVFLCTVCDIGPVDGVETKN